MKNTRNNSSNSIYFKSLFLVAIMVLASCNSKEKSEATNIDTAETIEDVDVITITESQFNSGEMKVGKITMQEFNTNVKANGMFAVPPQNQADVSTYFAGYVKDIKFLPGDIVKKGQVFSLLKILNKFRHSKIF